MGKKYYTTGEISKILGISYKTIHNYCVQGKIQSESTPITNYRRISHKNLVKFMKDNSLSLELLVKYSQKKVLVVDDDARIVTLLVQMLNDAFDNLSIETASDGYEACVKAGNFIPDIILLDINMPKADGFEVCQVLLDIEETKHAKIFIMTGYATNENIKKLKQYHIQENEIFQKPIDLRKLEETLKPLIGSLIRS